MNNIVQYYVCYLTRGQDTRDIFPMSINHSRCVNMNEINLHESRDTKLYTIILLDRGKFTQKKNLSQVLVN